MILIELLLLILTYSFLVVALFLEIICYKRKMESIETIALTLSLLLLIVTLSITPVLGNTIATYLTLICMNLVGTFTFFNVLEERQFKVKSVYKRLFMAIACGLTLTIIPAALWNGIEYIQIGTVTFLISSVMVSMLIVRKTKPQKKHAHLEKSERLFAGTFAILVPIYLILTFAFKEEYQHLQIGFLIPVVFILVAANKIYDDLHRLSILKNDNEPQQQYSKNYGLTPREEEIAQLLVKGCTYQNISEQLFISLPTVKTHASNTYKKCGVKTRHELTALLNH